MIGWLDTDLPSQSLMTASQSALQLQTTALTLPSSAPHAEQTLRGEIYFQSLTVRSQSGWGGPPC